MTSSADRGPLDAQALPVEWETALGAYEGRWVGEIRLSSFEGTPLKTIQVEQCYWRRGLCQEGFAIIREGRASENNWSTVYWNGQRLVSQARYPNGRTDSSLGSLTAGGVVVWSPRLTNDLGSRRLEETILVAGGQRRMILSGYEWAGVGQQRRLVIMEGVLLWRGLCEPPPDSALKLPEWDQ